MSNPLVKLEVSLEYQVDEILPSGKEKLIKPNTFFDELALTNIKMNKTQERAEDTSTRRLDQVREHLKLAYQEVAVLRDLLSICRSSDNFFALENVTREKPPGNSMDLDLISRKFALEKAHNILMEGYNRLFEHKSKARHDSNLELVKLRLNFPAKKFKEEVYGDLDIGGESGTFSKSTSFRMETTGDGHLRVSLPDALRYELFPRLSAERGELVLSLMSFLMQPEDDSFLTLNKAQNSLFFQKLFKTLSREVVQGGECLPARDRISLRLGANLMDNLNGHPNRPFLFMTLEYVLSFLFTQIMSKTVECDLFGRISLYLRNCLQRYGLLNYLRGTRFGDNLRVAEVADSFTSFHCIRMQLVMSLANVPRLDKISAEIRDGTTMLITSGGRVVRDCSPRDVASVIEAQAVLYKHEILEVVALKFGFLERPRPTVDRHCGEGDHCFVFARNSLSLVFVLNSLSDLRVYRSDGTELAEGKSGYIDKLEGIFCSLIDL